MNRSTITNPIDPRLEEQQHHFSFTDFTYREENSDHCQWIEQIEVQQAVLQIEEPRFLSYRFSNELNRSSSSSFYRRVSVRERRRDCKRCDSLERSPIDRRRTNRSRSSGSSKSILLSLSSRSSPRSTHQNDQGRNDTPADEPTDQSPTKANIHGDGNPVRTKISLSIDSRSFWSLPENGHVDPAEQRAESDGEDRELERRTCRSSSIRSFVHYRQRVGEPGGVGEERAEHGEGVVQESATASKESDADQREEQIRTGDGTIQLFLDRSSKDKCHTSLSLSLSRDLSPVEERFEQSADQRESDAKDVEGPELNARRSLSVRLFVFSHFELNGNPGDGQPVKENVRVGTQSEGRRVFPGLQSVVSMKVMQLETSPSLFSWSFTVHLRVRRS